MPACLPKINLIERPVALVRRAQGGSPSSLPMILSTDSEHEAWSHMLSSPIAFALGPLIDSLSMKCMNIRHALQPKAKSTY